MGLTGSLNGQVIYDMELETARRLAGVMNGQPSLEMNDLGRSTLQELSNMISGNAVINLSGSIVDGSLDITTPSLYVGEGTEIIERPGQSFIQTCLNTDHGTFFINLSAKETVTS